MEKSNSEINNKENSELQIEKYPYAKSPLLLDEFYIMGYTDILCNKKIIEPTISDIKSKLISDDYYKLKELRMCHLPTVLSTIVSETNIKRIPLNKLISYAFPIPPKFYFYIEKKEQKIIEPNTSNIIFNNINNETICNGYVYCFYEKKIFKINKDLIIHFFCPKFFVVISQYNFFFTFYKICKYIHEQFLSEKNEIPLEIQIYNLVNFLPCPLNNEIDLSIYGGSGILNCNNLNDYQNLIKDKINYIINLEQLGAYKHSEINFGKIFEVCSPKLIIQVLILILGGGNIAIFHDNLETLYYVLYFFYQITFPITPLEKVYCFSPDNYLSGDNISLDNYMSGFVCNFNNIKDFTRDKNILVFEKEQLKKRTGGGHERLKHIVLNLVDKSIKFYSPKDKINNDINNENDEQNIEEEPVFIEDRKRLMDINEYILSFFNEPDKFLDCRLMEIIHDLYISLQFLSKLIKENKYYSYFCENNDIKKYSLEIQEAFFRFICLFCNDYIKVTEKMTQKKEEENKSKGDEDEFGDKEIEEGKIVITDIEEKIYNSFKKTSFKDILFNIKDFYGKDEPEFMKATKINFINMLSMFNTNESNEILFKGHYLKFLDCIFANKQKIEKENISFLDFYKFYNEKMKDNIFNWIDNNDIIEKQMDKNKKNLLYNYKYKTINLNNNLIFRYNLYLNELDEKTKNQIFPKKVEMENKLYSRDIYNLIDDYLINNKFLSIVNLLQFCVLNIVILSTKDLKLLCFTNPIYELFTKMAFQIRKYVELILNVSYRILSNNSEIDSKEELNEYFNIYQKAIEEKKLYTNDQIYILRNKFKELIQQKKDGCILQPLNALKTILSSNEEKLFKLVHDKIKIDNIDDVQKEGTINQKISISGNLLDNKEISDICIYYPNTLYKKLEELVNKFYMDLDIEKYREEYYKLVLNTMFYIKLIEVKFPEDTLKFLFYCLIDKKDCVSKNYNNC